MSGLSVGLGIIITLSVSCTAQPPEDYALKSLRTMTKKGQLPAESVVADIESRYAGTKTAALARLLRARIRSEKGNPNGAALLLDSNVFAEKTSVADYAVWLRGKALLAANQDLRAQAAFADLIEKYPNSTRVRNARLLSAESMMKSGHTQKMLTILDPLVKENDPDALLLLAKGFEKVSNQQKAIEFHRRVYFYGAGTKAGSEAESWLTEQGQSLEPQNFEESLARADNLFEKARYKEAADAFETFARLYPNKVTSNVQLKRLTSFAKADQSAQATSAFNSIPISAKEKEEGYYQLALVLANARKWNELRKYFE